MRLFVSSVLGTFALILCLALVATVTDKATKPSSRNDGGVFEIYEHRWAIVEPDQDFSKDTVFALLANRKQVSLRLAEIPDGIEALKVFCVGLARNESREATDTKTDEVIAFWSSDEYCPKLGRTAVTSLFIEH